NEAKANEDADKKLREKAEKLNMADNLTFQTEKQLKEYGDKIPADKKETIEAAAKELQTARASEDLDAIDKALEALNNAWNAASQDIYNASQQAGATAENTDGAGQQAQDNVSDVDYEEVKDNK